MWKLKVYLLILQEQMKYDRTPAMVQLKRYLDFADLLEKNGIHIPLASLFQ